MLLKLIWRAMTEKGTISGVLMGLGGMIFHQEHYRAFYNLISLAQFQCLLVSIASLLDRKVTADVDEFMKKVYSKELETT
ncbi:hypothetical protein JFL43_06225 [Viridibacillus sp. YIM B01967]|uniref:Uncharacterized protein n=1 Tax=Viridibacillus soli TaxID=2798301 RepID=A0ABS1H5Z1_9BACL|nr:hypothetical protein [Viridibacillus soli]MBK3494463.1 hypothetical protein [Viridibacillus soli]